MSRGTSTIPRTAPIAIAPKPLEPATSSQHSSLGNDNGHSSNNMNGNDSADSDSSPQPRKRKLGRDPAVEEASWKRGYVVSGQPSLKGYPIPVHLPLTYCVLSAGAFPRLQRTNQRHHWS